MATPIEFQTRNPSLHFEKASHIRQNDHDSLGLKCSDVSCPRHQVGNRFRQQQHHPKLRHGVPQIVHGVNPLDFHRCLSLFSLMAFRAQYLRFIGQTHHARSSEWPLGRHMDCHAPTDRVHEPASSTFRKTQNFYDLSSAKHNARTRQILPLTMPRFDRHSKSRHQLRRFEFGYQTLSAPSSYLSRA